MAVGRRHERLPRRGRPARLRHAGGAGTRGRCSWPLGLALGAGRGVARAPGRGPRIVGYRALLSGEALPARVGDGRRAALLHGAHRRPLRAVAGVARGRPAGAHRHPVPARDGVRRRRTAAARCWSRAGTARLTGSESADQPLWIVPVGGGSARNTGPSRVRRGVVARRRADRVQRRLRRLLARARRRRCSSPASTASGPRKIHDAGVPIPWIRWSPDGARLRFAVFDRAEGRVVVDGDPGGRRCRAAPARARARRGDWSPDGRHFVFGRWGARRATRHGRARASTCTRGASRARLWPLGRASAVEQLTFGPMDFSSPVFTPDGRRLVVSGHRCGAWSCCGSSPASSRFARVPRVPGRLRRLLARRRVGRLGRRHAPDPVAQPARRLRAAAAHRTPDGRRARALVAGRPPARVRRPTRPAAASPAPCTSSRATAGALDSFADPNNALVWDPCWLDDQRVVWGNLYERGSVKLLDLRTRAISTLPGLGRDDGAEVRARRLRPRREGVEPGLLPLPSRDRPLGEPRRRARTSGTRPSPATARRCYGLSLDERAIYRFTLAGRRLEKRGRPRQRRADRPLDGGLDGPRPRRRPLLLRNTGISDLYVLDWDES